MGTTVREAADTDLRWWRPNLAVVSRRTVCAPEEGKGAARQVFWDKQLMNSHLPKWRPVKVALHAIFRHPGWYLGPSVRPAEAALVAVRSIVHSPAHERAMGVFVAGGDRAC
jgi:hypothetical protein